MSGGSGARPYSPFFLQSAQALLSGCFTSSRSDRALRSVVDLSTGNPSAWQRIVFTATDLVETSGLVGGYKRPKRHDNQVTHNALHAPFTSRRALHPGQILRHVSPILWQRQASSLSENQNRFLRDTSQPSGGHRQDGGFGRGQRSRLVLLLARREARGTTAHQDDVEHELTLT